MNLETLLGNSLLTSTMMGGAKNAEGLDVEGSEVGVVCLTDGQVEPTTIRLVRGKRFTGKCLGVSEWKMSSAHQGQGCPQREVNCSL